MFLLPYSSFLCLSFFRSSSFIQAGLVMPLYHISYSLQYATLELKVVSQLFWLSLLRIIFPTILPRRSLNRRKSSFLKIMVVILLFAISNSDLELFYLMTTAAKTIPNLHILKLSLLVCKKQVLNHLYWDMGINACQKFPWLLISCCAFLLENNKGGPSTL